MHKSRVKYDVKRVLARAGISLRMGGPASHSLLAAVRHLHAKGLRPQTVFDVGVADGTYELYDTFPQARHVLVEPMSEFKPALDAIVARYGADLVLAAADATEGTVTIQAGVASHGTSLLDQPVSEGRDLPTVTLDGVAERLGLRGPYLLKVDVQGAELRVLAGATAVLKEAAAVVLETSMFRFSEGMPLFHEVVAHLVELGFVPYDIFGGYTRPLDGALAQTDVVFVPRDSPLRADSRFASDEQREQDERRLMWKLRRRVGV